MVFKKEVVDKFFNRLEKVEVNGEIQYFRKERVFNGMNEDGTLNWKNLWTGGYWEIMGLKIWRVVGVLLFVLIALGCIYEYHLNFQVCSEVLSKINIEDMNVSNIFNITL